AATAGWAPGRGRARAGTAAWRHGAPRGRQTAVAPLSRARTRLRRRLAPRPTALLDPLPALLDGLLQRGSRGELRDSRGRDVDPLAGRRVTPLPRTALRDAELPEAGERDLAATAERALDRVQHGVNGAARVLLAQPGPICDLV